MPLNRYTSLKRKTPMRRTNPGAFGAKERKGLTRTCGIKKRGKKSEAWEKERARLKPLFERADITRCEVFANPATCWVNNALGFAHPRKRRNTPDALLGRVALACNVCHDFIERKPEAEMAALVDKIIDGRAQWQKDILGF